MAIASSTDVLIVGGGPTGTALAIDLTRRGIAVRLIDKASRGFDGSRAKGVQPRTLEVFHDLGVLPAVLAHGSLYPPMGIHLGPFTVPFRMMAKGSPGPAVPFPDTWLIPQSETNQALHEGFETLGGRVELGRELLKLDCRDSAVIAHVAGVDGQEQISARYVVGADGGGSTVRKQIGVPFTGETNSADRILIVDAAITGRLSRKYWHVWPGFGGRFIGACPLPHSELFQWMIRLAPDEQPPQSVDEINDRIQSHTRDRHLSVQNIAWQSVFRPNIRLAERYRHGRVLLAGDAAHVHTPAGAQGLNTGIGDAYNLGWKLAQVLAGANDVLLDTYEQERRPIAAAVLGLSTKKYDGIGKLDPGSYRRGKDEKQLTLTYFGGPLAASTTDRTATLRVGDRAPDADLVGIDGAHVRLFDIFQGPQFTAIAYGPQAAEALTQLEWPTTAAALHRYAIEAAPTTGEGVGALIDASQQFRNAYGIGTDTLLLIRPDGYIGHIATDNLAESARAAIAAWAPTTTSERPKE